MKKQVDLLFFRFSDTVYTFMQYAVMAACQPCANFTWLSRKCISAPWVAERNGSNVFKVSVSYASTAVEEIIVYVRAYSCWSLFHRSVTHFFYIFAHVHETKIKCVVWNAVKKLRYKGSLNSPTSQQYKAKKVTVFTKRVHGHVCTF